MLEPRFKQTEIKQARQKRRAFMTKVELLVNLISSIENPTQSLCEEDLDKMMAQLNKIENDEYLATLKNLVNQKKAEVRPSKNKPKMLLESESKEEIPQQAGRDSKKSIGLTQMIETKPPSTKPSKEKKITGLDIFFRKHQKTEAP